MNKKITLILAVFLTASLPAMSKPGSKMISSSKKTISEVDRKLLWAVQKGNVAEVRNALNADADANTARRSGETTLQLAINQKANIGIIMLLLQKGADPNQPINYTDLKHLTPLYFAYQIARPDIARELLNFGAEPILDEKYKSIRFEGFESEKTKKREQILKMIQEKKSKTETETQRKRGKCIVGRAIPPSSSMATEIKKQKDKQQ